VVGKAGLQQASPRAYKNHKSYR